MPHLRHAWDVETHTLLLQHHTITQKVTFAPPTSAAGYRLRVLRVTDLPMGPTAEGHSLEVQLGVSLYDEAYGAFYGTTVYSQPDAVDPGRAQQVSDSVIGGSTWVQVDPGSRFRMQRPVFFHSDTGGDAYEPRLGHPQAQRWAHHCRPL